MEAWRYRCPAPMTAQLPRPSGRLAEHPLRVRADKAGSKDAPGLDPAAIGYSLRSARLAKSKARENEISRRSMRWRKQNTSDRGHRRHGNPNSAREWAEHQKIRLP